MPRRPPALLLLAFVAVGCVDLTRPPELVGAAPPVDVTDGPLAADGAEADAPAIDAAIPIDAPHVDATILVDVIPPDAGAADAAPLVANGQFCASDDQCQSGACVRGLCCDGRCGQNCYSCALPGSLGQCTAVPAGQDPHDQCLQDDAARCAHDGTCDGKGACRNYQAGTQCAAGRCTGAMEFAASTCDGSGKCLAGGNRSCAPGMCMGSSCATHCTADSDCQNGFFCDSGACQTKRTAGAACGKANQCASGFCADSVCCSSVCGLPCYSCNVAGHAGQCTPVEAGQQPHGECPAESAATCGRAGGCNGSGACRVFASGTVCANTSCSANVETTAGVCNGLGSCRLGITRACAPYVCGPGSCLLTCNSAADCRPGLACTAGVCALTGGLIAHYQLDEESGTTAADSSGNGLDGTYLGETGVPTSSGVVPPGTLFDDPRSLLFVAANRHAVRVPAMPALLKPANNVTVTAWYRATVVDGPPGGAATGSELMSAGNQYSLRVRPTEIEFSKRTTMNGNGAFIQCRTAVPNHLDGNWHHLAGVTTPAGMKTYFDGVERCTNTVGGDIRYDQGPDLFLGRHGFDQTIYDFDGNLDDVRIYNRALSPDDIAWLASGGG
jgi:hypothetical protein